MARLLLLLAAAVASTAAGKFTCPPVSNQSPHVVCHCTNKCAVGDPKLNTPAPYTYVWGAPKFPPPPVDLGADTLCATVTMPVLPATAAMTQYLGLCGNVTYGAPGQKCVPTCRAGRLVPGPRAWSQEQPRRPRPALPESPYA